MDYINDFTYCGNCTKTDGSVYTSNPPQIKCTVTGEFHFMDESCNCKKNKYVHDVAKKYKDSDSQTLVVNLFGTPGAGKSSLTAYIFSKLKFAGVNAEMATEFAKDKVWEESVEVFKNQAYIFGKQYFRLSRVKNKVEAIVTDSPILLSPFYNTQPELGYHFDMMCLDVFHSFNNYNAFLKRVKPYNPAGRFQTEEESDELNEPLKDLLTKFEIPYLDYDGDFGGGDKIVADILYILGKKNPY